VRTPDEQSDRDADVASALGAEVHRRRRDAGLSMAALAAKAGVSQPFISRLERGRASPSMSTLTRLAAALGVAPGDLIAPAARVPSDVRFVPADGGLRVPVSEQPGSAVGRVIASGRNAGLEFVEYRVAPSERLDDWFEFVGELVVYVVEGRLEVEVDGVGTWTLGPRDAMHHDAVLPHRWRPAGDDPVYALFAAVRPGSDEATPFAAR
jgi:transcriptional regulator with XRE-family HTH domain